MAISQADYELQNNLMNLANTIAKGNTSLQRALQDHAKKLAETQEDVIKEYKDYLNKSRLWHGKADEEAKNQLVKLRKLELEREKALKDTNKANNEYKAQLKKLNSELAEVERNSRKYAKDSAKFNRLDDKAKLIKQQISDQKQQFAIEASQRRMAIAAGSQAALERSVMERKELSATAKWGGALRTGVTNAAVGAFSGLFKNASISAAFVTVGKDAVSAIKEGSKTGGYGIDVLPQSMGGNAFNAHTMALYGMNMNEAVKMQAEERHTILSNTRGMNEFMDGLSDAQAAFKDDLIDPADRTKAAIDSYNIAVNAGIRMSKSQATMFAVNSSKIAKLTGENANDYIKHIGDIMNSEEARDSLLGAATEQQRKAILDSVNAQYAQNRALGISTEQSIKLTKSMLGLENRKGKTVIEQSAKMAALASTLGMGREGAELRRIEMKRQDASPEERARAQAIREQMRNKMDEKTRGRITGSTLSYEALSQNLGLDETYGKEYNTRGALATSPTSAAEKTLPQIPTELKRSTEVLIQIKNILDKDFAAILGMGAVGSVAGLFGTGILSSLFGGGAAAAGGAALAPAAGTAVGGAAAGAAAGAGAAATGGTGAAAAGGAATGIGGILAAAGLAIAPLAAIGGASKWASDTSHDQERTQSLLGVSKWLQNIMPDWMGDPSKAARDKREAQLRELNGGGEYTATPARSKINNTLKNNFHDDVTSKHTTDIKTATSQTALHTEAQLKQMKQDHELLKSLSEASARQTELAEKQLVALTMTDAEKSNANTRKSLRQDNRFATQYGYLK